MRRITAVVVLVLAFPAVAAATDCVQTDGQPGVQLVGISGDAGCQTAGEYEQVFSAPNLLDHGIIAGFTVNPDGTTSLNFGNAVSVVPSNPLDQKVAANRHEERPTVREILYATHRLTGGGPQEF